MSTPHMNGLLSQHNPLCGEATHTALRKQGWGGKSEGPGHGAGQGTHSQAYACKDPEPLPLVPAQK